MNIVGLGLPLQRWFRLVVMHAWVLVFKGPVFSVLDKSQQWLDGNLSSERGPPIIFHSLSIPKFLDYLDNGSLNCLHSRGDPPVFCRFHLLQ
jgi:hypothetical protein